jgi:chromate reductase
MLAIDESVSFQIAELLCEHSLRHFGDKPPQLAETKRAVVFKIVENRGLPLATEHVDDTFNRTRPIVLLPLRHGSHNVYLVTNLYLVDTIILDFNNIPQACDTHTNDSRDRGGRSLGPGMYGRTHRRTFRIWGFLHSGTFENEPIMSKPKILALAGSTRKQSFNKQLVALAASFARQNDAEVTLIDLRDFPLPLYDGDLEGSGGLPENGVKLYELFTTHDAILLSSPEYNSSLSGVLKNAIDWVSRPREGDAPLAAFTGKVAGLLSASPGQLGGLRGLVHVRSILGNIGVLVIPDQVAVGSAHKAFSEDGSLNDERLSARIEHMVQSLVSTTRRLTREQV